MIIESTGPQQLCRLPFRAAAAVRGGHLGLRAEPVSQEGDQRAIV